MDVLRVPVPAYINLDFEKYAAFMDEGVRRIVRAANIPEDYTFGNGRTIQQLTRDLIVIDYIRMAMNAETDAYQHAWMEEGRVQWLDQFARDDDGTD